jgi:hypothetical protein
MKAMSDSISRIASRPDRVCGRPILTFATEYTRASTRGDLTRAAWVRQCERTLDDACFYYPHRRMFAALNDTFRTPVEDIAADYMRTRLGERARFIPALGDPLLRFVYHKRAGEIVAVRKSA